MNSGGPDRDRARLRDALAAVADARVTLVLGDCDTGKTSLVAALAVALASGGLPVAVVDADLGQSEIGPPTTIGLGRVAGPLDRLAEAELLALEFIGATSPARHIRETARATERLVARALAAGYPRVLVDTSGLVAGDLGRALKRSKIGAVMPDVVLALQRAGECEHILAGCDAGALPGVARLSASEDATRRGPEERRRRRERALDAYFARAVPVQLAAAELVVRGGPLVAGVLVGLHDADGLTLGVGRFASVDPDGRTLTVDATVEPRVVAAITVGHEQYPG